MKVTPEDAVSVIYGQNDADAWMGAWSPKGNEIIITRAFWLLYDDVYYLTHLQPARIFVGSDTIIVPDNSGRDALPDWRPIDLTAPQSRIAVLPRFSRAPTDVTWWMSDGAGVGVERVELETTDVTAGTTSVVGLDAPHFDKRQIDGTPGHTYRFRVRAIDGADNAEAWNESATETTFYTWAVRGRATGVRGQPLGGVTARTTEAALAEEPSRDGTYRTLFAARPAQVDARWEGGAARLPLPLTRLATESDAVRDVTLPSADNVVMNWGFEDGGLAGWTRAGENLAVASGDQLHTGSRAAWLGGEAPLLAPQPLALPPHVGDQLVSAADATGRVYVVAADPGIARPLTLSTLQPDGTATVQPVPGATGVAPALAVSPQGVADLAWFAEEGAGEALYHARRELAGVWSPPARLGAEYHVRAVSLAVDAGGALHLLTSRRSSVGAEVVYLRRDPSGIWSAPETLDVGGDVLTLHIIADGAGRVHAAWSHSGRVGNHAAEVGYRMREASGGWTPETVLESWTDNDPACALAVDTEGRAHVVWRSFFGSQPGPLVYAAQAPDGAWRKQLLDGRPEQGFALAAGAGGTVHAAWARADAVAYAQLAPATAGAPQVRLMPAASVGRVLLAARGGAVYAGWLESRGAGYSHNGVWAQVSDAGWGRPRLIGYVGKLSGFQIVATSDGRPSAQWRGSSAVEYFVARPAAASTRSALAQKLTVPAAMTGPTLSAMLLLDKPWAGGAAAVEVRVVDASGQRTTLETVTREAPGWRHLWWDLTPWQGQKVTVEFEARSEAGGPLAAAFLDEVTVSTGLRADTWVEPALGGIPAGATGRLTLYYGNRGDFAADTAALRLTLPAGVTLVAADPPGQVEGGDWKWQAGALPVGAQGKIEVEVRNDAGPGDPGRLRIQISAGPGEVELGDNDVTAMVWGTRRILLPRVGR